MSAALLPILERHQSKKPTHSSSYHQASINISLGLLDSITYHIYTLWLFTCDQMLDVMVPALLFSVSGTLSGKILGFPVQSFLEVIQRVPKLFGLLWLYILQICLHNQHSPDSIAEDSINKPWRPLPAKRMTSAQAQQLLRVVQVAGAFASYQLGVLPHFGFYLCLASIYNDFDGGNHSGWSRNLLCGCFFALYFSAAMNVATGTEVSMGTPAWLWTLIIAFGVIPTTIQAQDFRDEVGDKARDRRTFVTEYDRSPMLWALLIMTLFWTFCLPLVYFKGDWKTTAFPVIVGGGFPAMIFQSMRYNDTKVDRIMYKTWGLWMMSLCPLPLLKSIMG